MEVLKNMTKRYVVIGVVVMLVLAAILAAYVLRDPAEASEPIEAVPLAIATEETTTAVEATQVPPTEAVVSVEPTAESITEPTTESTTPTEEPAATAAPETGSPMLFEISQDSSQVSFELDEDLRGVRTTVLGVTNQVAGQIAFNPVDLSTAQVGTILVNSRTLATENDFRNRAIQNEILDTGSYEYITFVPTSIEGLPASVAVGQEVTFTILGDLTIRDITQQVTFQVTAVLTSDTQLTGTATTTVLRGDYGLQIPNVPSVANVEDEVVLTIQFTANNA
jgi:polyisoprenoid-binding protein YceI